VNTPDLCIWDYTIRLPGSQHDSTAWKQTWIHANYEQCFTITSLSLQIQPTLLWPGSPYLQQEGGRYHGPWYWHWSHHHHHHQTYRHWHSGTHRSTQILTASRLNSHQVIGWMQQKAKVISKGATTIWDCRFVIDWTASYEHMPALVFWTLTTKFICKEY
jgi:hypothetical protein